MVWNESRGRPNVGYDPTHTTTGITQIDREVWNRYGNGQNYEFIENPANYEAEMDATAKFLKHLYNKYHTWRLAEAGYNEGETVLDEVRAGERNLSPITERYIAGVTN